MVRRSRIIDYWGEENLVRIPDPLLTTVDIPEATKDFLSRVGFPKQFQILGGYYLEPLSYLVP